MKYIKLLIYIFFPLSVMASDIQNKKRTAPIIKTPTTAMQKNMPSQPIRAIEHVSMHGENATPRVASDTQDKRRAAPIIKKPTTAMQKNMLATPTRTRKAISVHRGIPICPVAIEQPKPLAQIPTIIDKKITQALQKTHAIRKELDSLKKYHLYRVNIDKEILKLYDSYVNADDQLGEIPQLMAEHSEYTKEKTVGVAITFLNRVKEAMILELILLVIKDHITTLASIVRKLSVDNLEARLYGGGKNRDWDYYNLVINYLRRIISTYSPMIHEMQTNQDLKKQKTEIAQEFSTFKKLMINLLDAVALHIKTTIKNNTFDALFLNRWSAIYGRIKSNFELLNNELVDLGFVTEKIELSKTHKELIELAETAEKAQLK